MERKRLLVAASSEGQAIVQQSLARRYDLTSVSKLGQAKRLLYAATAGDFDMVIADVHFDDCRMFDLLEVIRSADHLGSLPFLALQSKGGFAGDMESIKKSLQILGASAFLELHNLPDGTAVNTILATVEQSFDKAVKHMRLDKSSKKH